MPTNAVMMVYMENYHEEEVLSGLRAELMGQFDLSKEDFYSEGPLVYMSRDDYDLAHLVGEPGYLLSVNTCLPYYGAGYERGDLPHFVQVAEWLEKKITGCRVLYGNDSSGEGWPFDATIRAKLLGYYKKVGHEPYSRKDLSWEQRRQFWLDCDTERL